nr:protein transport protein bet1 [Quercus suber]
MRLRRGTWNRVYELSFSTQCDLRDRGAVTAIVVVSAEALQKAGNDFISLAASDDHVRFASAVLRYALVPPVAAAGEVYSNLAIPSRRTMASRFQRDSSRNALFSNYDPQSRSRPSPITPSSRPASRNAAFPAFQAGAPSSPYGYSDGGHLNAGAGAAGFQAYPSGEHARDSHDGGFRPATPNRKGQYSDAVIDELESQNDEQVGEMSKKVRMLKEITIAIGGEIRDSTAFAEKMNDNFEGTRNRLRGTMNRMLRMAERTGVGWRTFENLHVGVAGTHYQGLSEYADGMQDFLSSM